MVHAHPATVVLFTICNKPLLPLYGAYDPSSLKLLTEGIPTYPRSITVSNDKLGEEFSTRWPRRACMMRGHRIIDRRSFGAGSHADGDQLNELAKMVNYAHNSWVIRSLSPTTKSRISRAAKTRARTKRRCGAIIAAWWGRND